MDFKWTLSRPGISLEFETGSVKEAVGLLEQEGSAIQDVFGLTMGHTQQAVAPEAQQAAEAPAAAEKPKRGRPAKAAPEAVAPEPMPVPPVPVNVALRFPSPSVAGVTSETAPPLAPTPTPLPVNELAPNENGVPAFLDRTSASAAPPPLPTPPPVGVLGPKMVAVLDEKAKQAVDGGQALADWLAKCGLTISGKSLPEACRALLMISDEKLGPAAAILGVS